tara:strand:+ start:7549 stop:8727 length:1179 start_codon:yes stop_codon:yes gene_type:complete
MSLIISLNNDTYKKISSKSKSIKININKEQDKKDKIIIKDGKIKDGKIKDGNIKARKIILNIRFKIEDNLYNNINYNLSSLLQFYYNQKRNNEYTFPVGSRIKVMKGKFFYDHTTSHYSTDPEGWWVSEKLDGIRAIWTGRKLLTRTGRKINAPKWWLADLPDRIALDGELYLGRNRFNDVQSIVMDSSSSSYLWKNIKYYVFDIPDSLKMPFEDVQTILNNYLPKNDYLNVIFQTKINSLDHLLELQKILVSQGAEGTMLRKPKTRYRVGETYNLLKFKTNMNDTTGSNKNEMVHLLDEVGIITGYNYNYAKMKPDGKAILKSVLVKWVDKEKYYKDPEFSVSHHITQKEKRGNFRDLFPIGQKVKIVFNQLFESSQKPRFPRYGGWAMDV